MFSCILYPMSLFFFTSEEYCCSSRAFGSWRRFGASLRSWELHLLLTRAVLVRRRKTLRDISRMPPKVTSQRPSQVAPQAALTRMSSQASSETSLQGLPGNTLNTQLGAQDMPGEMKAGTSPPPSASAGIFFQRVSSSNTETEPAAARGGEEQIASSLERTDLLLSVQEAESTVEGIPWVSKAPEDCDALVLPPCTRIVHLLQLHCNNKLVTAMAEGLLLRKPAYKSLIRTEERKTGVTSRSSSGDSDYGFGSRAYQFCCCVSSPWHLPSFSGSFLFCISFISSGAASRQFVFFLCFPPWCCCCCCLKRLQLPLIVTLRVQLAARRSSYLQLFACICLSRNCRSWRHLCRLLSRGLPHL